MTDDRKRNESASVWNNVISPGFTKEEVDLLRLALMKYGCGNWLKICRHFPFKKQFQLNVQTQRMFGQQSLREFSELHLDPKLVLEKNSLLNNVTRKSGIIIAKTTAEERKKAHEAYKKLQISIEDRDKIDLPVYVGSNPEVGEKNTRGEILKEMDTMLFLAHRLQKIANRKRAEAILKDRGGRGDVGKILEELRADRIKRNQELLRQEEIEFQMLLEKDKRHMDVDAQATH